MRKASVSDKDLVIKIISETFMENEGVNWMFSKRGSKDKKLRRLAEFTFWKCYNRDGVYLSDNEMGVALCYRNDKKVFSLKEKFFELKYALTSIPWKRIPEVLKREASRNKIRSQDEVFYYFWFLGVLKEGTNAGFELYQEIEDIARADNIPIYLETAMEKNMKVYSRRGYECYHHWKDDVKGIDFWFLRKRF